MPQTLLPRDQALLVTKPGFDALVARLAELREARERAAGTDPAPGDDTAELTDRIILVETALARAVIAHGARHGYALAAVGTVVEVDDGARPCAYRLVLLHDEGDDTAATPVSVLSPVGAALMGRAVGDAVEIALPNRRLRSLLVRRIRDDA
ncbi:GreA/GreB family elongation factor [Patulibacter sp. NPDC049589]|uniref:GreA/GreB family elongation factor n=1 Tax=Patulibacter sp. NPDC049589 TaxID=3154731 RepID=UPI00342F7BC0